MTLINSREGYGWLSIAMHWLMLLLLIAVYATMEFKGAYPRGSAGRQTIMQWHYMLGMSAFALTGLRLVFRWMGATPRIVPEPPAWQDRLATLSHWLLYLMLFGLPLLGWLTLSAKGEPIPFFGLQLPALMGKNPDAGKQLKDVHESIATFGYFLIGLHAAAALYHHYFRRDNTMRLMLPRS